MNKEKLNAAGEQWCQASDCCMSTLVLGIYAVGAQWCQASDFHVSTLVLGIWCGKNKDLGKTGHLEDRTLSDVTEEKTFDWWSKGRVTSEIDVSPQENW